jgi:hypothetical protein
MAEFINNYEYLLGWCVYATAGIGCCAVWWRMTRYISHRGWRELLRGVVVVLVFTPWYVGDTPEFYAPAVVVLVMDLLLEGAEAGLSAGPALLISSFLMLCVLTGRILLLSRPKKG